MLTTPQIISKYGQPGDTKNFTTINLPYPMRISWDMGHVVNKMQCHKLIADNFKIVFATLLKTYGLIKLKELRIDVFGGCYNFRQMRGGSDWSRHSWAIAADLDPINNDLHTKWKNAEFAKPEYKQMVDIFYANGFVNQGIEKGFDPMHWEIKS